MFLKGKLSAIEDAECDLKKMKFAGKYKLHLTILTTIDKATGQLCSETTKFATHDERLHDRMYLKIGRGTHIVAQTRSKLQIPLSGQFCVERW